jgi:serine/threonine protein kinase/Tol biopolymer transport system component
LIGSTVSHYRILERLGGGGMGVVYKALNLKLDRFVALKFLSAQRSATDEYKRRFAREAKAASALDHPNICTVYDIDETPDGHIFIAMALCEGETLKRKLERGPLAVDEAIEIAAQVASGLGQAHARGIVHRDVKPGNVIVAPDGGVKLVDFGIAKLADHSRITRVGTAVGTAAYMAPEQFRDEAIDSRVDIWALGVLLYEMVTGRLPFDDEDEKELIRQILTGEPKPLRGQREGIPEGLEKVLARALAKRPAERYLQMEEMRTDLVRLAGSTDSWTSMDPTIVDVPGRPHSTTHPTELSATSLVGRTIARYRVIEHLGGGGMGVIYKAEDTQLSRIVALKFLPPELVRDPDAKARFLQEARSASSLEHPNICTVHEIGEDEEGRLYIVMPCYDGETLRRKIERGPLSVDEATEIALQVARGLHKAHRAGIVHRDIKPANLVVTSDGVVKILDFGLAKLAGSLALTRTGSSLGTPAYMSPEQTKGEPVDHRADLWSLGVVLYEMLAGRRPFRGDHDQAVLYSILNEEPQPLSQARVDIPQELERVIDGLLKKTVAERFPSIDGPLLALSKLRNEPLTRTFATEITDAERAAERRSWLRTGIVAAAFLALAAAVAAWLLFGSTTGDKMPGTKFERLTMQEGRESFPSLSPDGSYFVYAKSVGDNYDIFLQRVGGGNPQNLTQGSPLADTHPTFSPDGKQIVFRSERDGGGLFRMGATGESVTRLTKFGYDPSWSPDGKEVLFATESIDSPATRRTTSAIWHIDIAEGEAKRIPTADAVQPAWSPHGHRIAFWGLQGGSAQRKIWTVRPDGSAPVLAVVGDSVNWNPVWSPDGKYLYFASDRSGVMSLWRVEIDEETGKVSDADPQMVPSQSPSSAFMSFSSDGRKILYAANNSKANIEKVAFDPQALRVSGSLAPVTEGARSVRSLAVSPDGRWIAFYSTTPFEDLFVVGVDGSGLRQLTNDRANDRQPQWSLPDGRRLVFYSYRPDRYEVWAIPAEGGSLEPLTRTKGPSPTVPVLSPDGRRMAVSVDRGEVLVDLTAPLEKRRLVPLPRKDPAKESFFASSWSPNGLFLAGDLSSTDNSTPAGVGYYSLEDGRSVRLTNSGTTPLWMSNNRTLLYTDDGKVMAVDRESGRIQVVLQPRANSEFIGVGVSPDGRTLYAIRADQQEDVWLLTFQ